MGKILERLRRSIEDQGFSNVELRPATGHWRTSVMADVHRWDGFGTSGGLHGVPAGSRVTFSSWDTMTACVRRGIEISRDGASWQFDVSAKDVPG